MMEQNPWVVKLLDGRTVSPSEFERLAGSLRKNWKSSTSVLQAICTPMPGPLRACITSKQFWGLYIEMKRLGAKANMDRQACAGSQGIIGDDEKPAHQALPFICHRPRCRTFADPVMVA